jgi:hypothetical protein
MFAENLKSSYFSLFIMLCILGVVSYFIPTTIKRFKVDSSHSSLAKLALILNFMQNIFFYHQNGI